MSLIKRLKKNYKKFVLQLLLFQTLMLIHVTRINAAGNVSGAIEGAWNSAESEIQSVVNNVVFPVIDLVLAVFFFVKLGTAYFDYRKQGQFEWAAPAILFSCLCFTLTAPNYIWNIL